jgi:biotin carboxyl carrier protein
VNIDVMVNGRPWKVAVDAAEPAGKFTVTIKGTSRIIDASWTDEDTLSLIDAGAASEIRLHARTENGAVGVEIGGKLYEAVVSPGDTKPGRVQWPDGGATKIAPGPVSIKAPMPGRVVRVLVAVGDQVSARQPVVVVEAMKMENELRTPKGGTVKEILAVPGTAVEAGAVLVTVVDH